MKLILVAVALVSILAEARIDIKVTPGVCFNPCSILVDLVVLPHDENRWAVIVLDGPNVYRSSQIQLNGGEATKRYTFSYRDLPDGEYEIIGVLYNSTKEVTRARRALIVAETNQLKRKGEM